MPTNPHYESVRAKVIAACPELMELSFGARLHRHNKMYNYYSVYYVLTYVGQGRSGDLVWISSVPFGSMTIDISKDEIKNGGEFEIIGHPIRLSHVLLTFCKSEKRYIVDTDYLNSISIENLQDEALWNLEKDTLEDQSPETWESLDKMLSV